jgi:hypothetical protein
MGWGSCGTDSKGRPIGYLHRGKCDHPGCKERIDRGVAHACGGMHGTGEGGCEGYFCEKHLSTVEDPHGWVGRQEGFAVLCESCKNEHNARLVEDLIDELKELREGQAMTTPYTDAQLDRMRQTIAPIIEEWRTDYHIPNGKEHGQLVNRIVAAIAAMHQSGVLTIRDGDGR